MSRPKTRAHATRLLLLFNPEPSARPAVQCTLSVFPGLGSFGRQLDNTQAILEDYTVGLTSATPLTMIGGAELSEPGEAHVLCRAFGSSVRTSFLAISAVRVGTLTT